MIIIIIGLKHVHEAQLQKTQPPHNQQQNFEQKGKEEQNKKRSQAGKQVSF